MARAAWDEPSTTSSRVLRVGVTNPSSAFGVLDTHRLEAAARHASIAFLLVVIYRAAHLRSSIGPGKMIQQPQTIADWLTPKRDDSRTREQWQRGHHRLQVAVDTIAYSHNVPVRILLVDRMRKLPDVVAKLLRDENVVNQLRRIEPALDPDQLAQFATAAFLHRLQQTLEGAASERQDDKGLAGEWLPRAFLALAPYIERKVWLTEMGNPLPVHSLCRMHDLWALHVLLWTWSHVEQLAQPSGRVAGALGVGGLVVRTLETFEIREPDGPPQYAIPIVGPYFEMDMGHAPGSGAQRVEFVALFERLIDSASRSRFVEDPRQDGTPTYDELVEASNAKIPLTPDEALIRSRSVARSLDYFRGCELGSASDLDQLDRTGWEIIAALCAWMARWESALARFLRPSRVVALRHAECLLELRISRRRNSRTHQPSLNVAIHIADGIASPANLVAVESFLDQIEMAEQKALKKSLKLPSAYRIDRPGRYVARVRERQAAAWSSQLTAINNLLLRHSPRVVEVGPDPFGPSQGSEAVTTPIEAKHLLRGYGQRVCKHLVSLARADGASVFWLDYSYSPPRLIRVGDHFRHPAHSADSLGSWTRFDSHVWAAALDSAQLHVSRARATKVSQNYRVAYSGREEPPDGTELGPLASSDRRSSGSGQQGVEGQQEGPSDRGPRSYFDCYPAPTPRDSMAVPLLVSGRVIGVLSITGIVERQFDASLVWPLRRSAALIASCISHANEVWHLRRLNYVFAENGITALRVPVSERGSNPLRDVARCLSNIFLCSTANIWIQSASNARRLELAGSSRPDLFPLGTTLSDSIFEFYDTDPPATAQDLTRTFSSLALDLWRDKSAAKSPPIGQFVKAVFDRSVEQTVGYDAKSASTRGAMLGKDFIERAGHPEQASRFIRERVFSPDPADGHGLADMMAFALVKPAEQGWVPVGVVTLHDEGRASLPGSSRMRAWDYGWAPVVAQMQTHLPYLFRQAELLYGPETSGRTYVMHALRGELIPLTDRALRLHSRASAIVGRLGSAHDKLKRLPATEARSRTQLDLLEEISSELREVWTGIEGVVIGATSQRIRFLANVANNYKTLTALVTDISTGSDFSSVNLHELLDQLMRDVRAANAPEPLSIELSISPDLRVSLPEEWLRMVLRELLRNIEKYSERAPVQIAWSVQHRALRFVNDCIYDPKTDTPERLMEYRYRGAAARHALLRGEPRFGSSVVLPGEGMGLWGIRQICDALGVGFNIHVQPKASNAVPREGLGASLAHGQFVATLIFPAGVVNAGAIVPLLDDDFV